jgi:hypothetical protein
MAGGLLNLVSVGNANIILTGNPSKTFFRVTYSKYTNFGLQKFRIDFDGSRDLRLTEPSKYTFRMKRYADLLMDTYVCINLPDIWSPIYPPSADTSGNWSPYEFKWIENLGAQMISEIEIQCGSVTLQRYSGEYIMAIVERDFNGTKKDLFYKMSGNVPELNDPANNPDRVRAPPYYTNAYPSAVYTSAQGGAEPSIRGRTLYVPIQAWFTMDSRCAFPMVCLQYNELIINVTLRPIQELFQVRDVFDASNGYPYVQPDFNQDRFQMYRFLQTPPDVDISSINYSNQVKTWNADVYMLSTYCFLSNEEQQLFAAQDQVYLVKDIFEYNYLNITGSSKVKLESSSGMVSNWMFYLQRNDVQLRNEWSNYTNWAYEGVIPQNIIIDQNSDLFSSGDFSFYNHKPILETMGILLDGDYRENTFPRGIYDYVEKYTRTSGTAKEGLYCYNFCLNSSSSEYQPSGAMNMSKFKNIELELTTYLPPIDAEGSKYNVICDANGQPLSVSTKPGWAFYVYNYNIHIFEERYNVLSFIGGNCGLMYAR